MVGLKVSLLCLTIAGSMHGALACDATGMQQCQTDYMTGLGAAQAGGGMKVCDHINTMISCLSSKCSGCAAGATTAFNMIVDNAKTSACASGGTCPGHALCGASMSCGAATSSSVARAAFQFAPLAACFLAVGA